MAFIINLKTIFFGSAIGDLWNKFLDIIQYFARNILLPALVIALIGFVLGVLIYIVSKVFYVEEDPAIEEVVELLPRYNCGACGHPGCKEMAISLLKKETDVMACKPIKKDAAEELKKYLKEHFAK